MTGLARKEAATALGGLFSTVPRYEGGIYDAWSVTDPQGKAWKIVSDSSIHATRKQGRRQISAGTGQEYKVEMNSPKLEYAEMEKLQSVVRTLRSVGEVVNSSCGMHYQKLEIMQSRCKICG